MQKKTKSRIREILGEVLATVFFVADILLLTILGGLICR